MIFADICRRWLQHWLPGAGAALLLMLLSPTPTLANDAPLQVEVARFVFGNWIPNRSWTPMQTRVVNRSDQPITAAIVFAYDLGGRPGDTVQYVRQVTMPPQSSRQIETSVLIDYPPEALTELYAGESQQQVQFSDGREIEYTRRQIRNIAFSVRAINVRSGQEYPGVPVFGRPTQPDMLTTIMTNSEEAYSTGGNANKTFTLDGLSYVLGEHEHDLHAKHSRSWPASAVFSNRNIPPPALLANQHLTASHLNAADLPRRWAAYEGVSTLILGNLQPHTHPWILSLQQRHSLLRWVRSGGRLIIMPAHDLQTYSHPFWDQLLPVRLLGRRLLDAELAPLEKQYAKKVHFDSKLPPLIADALPRADSEIILGDANRVLAARRQVGNGEVWFVAVTGDALNDWSQGPEFFARMLRPHANAVPGLKSELGISAEQILSSIVGAAAPSRTPLLVILGSYLLLCAAALWLFGRRGHPELAWPVMLLLAGIAGIAAVGVGRATRAQIGFVQGEIGVTELVSNESQGSATSFVGFYAPRAINEDLHWCNADTLATGHPVVTGDSGSRAITRNLTIDQGDQFRFLNLRLAPGELRLARAMTLVNYGNGIDLQFGYDENGVCGYVQNNSGMPLYDCIVRINRRSVQVGNLAVGQRRELSNCQLSWRLSSSDYDLAADPDAVIRSQILAEVLRQRHGVVHGQQHHYNWPVALYAWTKTIQADATLPSQAQPRQRPLQLLVVPARQIKGEGAVAVPAGACGLKLLNSSTARFAFGDPPRKIDVAHVRLPQLQRIAGGSSSAGGDSDNTQNRRHEPEYSSADSMNQRSGTSGFAAAENHDPDPLAATSWKSNEIPVNLNIGFSHPQGLEAMRIERLMLVLDITMTGFELDLRIRRVGSTTYEPLLSQPYSGGKRLQLELQPLANYLGANGELPEFQLRIMQPTQRQSVRSGHWQIREFDLKLWGTMPAASPPVTGAAASLPAI